MNKENWIQRWRPGPIYLYKSCSVAHEDKMAELEKKNTRIIPGSLVIFRIHWALVLVFFSLSLAPIRSVTAGSAKSNQFIG